MGKLTNSMSSSFSPGKLLLTQMQLGDMGARAHTHAHAAMVGVQHIAVRMGDSEEEAQECVGREELR